jgi:hypothetical protein
MLAALTPFLQKLSRSQFATEAAVADNCRFDERAAQKRWDALASLLPNGIHSSLGYEEWSEAADLHGRKRVNVPSASIPDAFLDINQPAWLNNLVPDQELVRLEALDWPLASVWNISIDELRALHTAPAAKQPDAAQTLTRMINDWNRQRDNRPIFAAFLDEVQAEADDPNWSHRLRDRLGLGHYSPNHGTRIPVALMRYTLQEVLNAQKAKGLAAACALPTALDGGMHEYFFPVPKQHPYGATLHLERDKGDVLAAEIIHCRIDYQSKHLWKLGWIDRPHFFAGAHDVASQAARDARLKDARDLHLTQLRIEAGCNDFAEEMVGRS